jgi:hypothetical protein
MRAWRRAPSPPTERPLIRRDADGGERTAPDWETLTERLIREALEAGAFDELPGRGQPLPLEDETYTGDMALAHHVLRNAGAAPPWIETDKEVRALASRIETLLHRARRAPPRAEVRFRRELDELSAAHDDAVRRLEGLAPTPRQQRRRLDRERLRARLDAALPDSESDA